MFGIELPPARIIYQTHVRHVKSNRNLKNVPLDIPLATCWEKVSILHGVTPLARIIHQSRVHHVKSNRDLVNISIDIPSVLVVSSVCLQKKKNNIKSNVWHQNNYFSCTCATCQPCTIQSKWTDLFVNIDTIGLLPSIFVAKTFGLSFFNLFLFLITFQAPICSVRCAHAIRKGQTLASSSSAAGSNNLIWWWPRWPWWWPWWWSWWPVRCVHAIRKGQTVASSSSSAGKMIWTKHSQPFLFCHDFLKCCSVCVKIKQSKLKKINS